MTLVTFAEETGLEGAAGLAGVAGLEGAGAAAGRAGAALGDGAGVVGDAMASAGIGFRCFYLAVGMNRFLGSSYILAVYGFICIVHFPFGSCPAV